jgi:hypothetical protein
MAAVNSAWVDTTTGRVLLPVNRFTGNAIYRVVGEADGPLHLAIVESGGACSLGTYVSIHDGHVVYTAGQDKSTSSGPSPVQYGAIGGALDDVPRVIRLATAGLVPDYYAGANAFFEWGGGLTLRSWTDGSSLAALSLSDPGDPGEPGFQGDALYFQVADLDYSRIKIYTPANGLRDLISYGNDVSHNAADFGTDGVDMLWVEGIGRSQGGIGQRFATYDIMTAPYTTDATSVQKRRLRSAATELFRIAPFAVGCGYASREVYQVDPDGSVQQGVRIVRIADGFSWKLLNTESRAWAAPVALTCEEVFVNTFAAGSGTNLARVRLDSLGAGEPPD